VLIDSAIANPPGPGGAGEMDVTGLPRVIGAAPDVGAYEVDRLFYDGFDTPCCS